jgi:hypothetical protein
MGAAMQMGTPNEDYSYPQPLEFSATIDATAWGKVFFLSPIEGRVATESEMLYISDEKMQYLKKLIIEIKFLRNWCIAQVAQRVVRVTDDDAVRVIEDGTTIRRA